MHGIFETIRQYHMIGEGMHVIAGVSGGADSVCLLYVLCEYRKQVPFALTAVHVEHGLRGEESLADAEFTRALCERLDVPCRVVHAQVERLARAEGISEEEAGRRERYRIFREIQKECGAQRIAVAHNRDDQAETVLWNLARGSGLRGLSGMSPLRGDVIRPLLFTGRERIEQILAEAGLTWRTDRTNLQCGYTRNRIRLLVLPEMERELNVRAAEHIAAAAGRLRQVQDYLDRVTDRAQELCIRREGDSVCIDLKAFSGQDALIREELLKRAAALCGGLRDFGSPHLQALLGLCGMDCGRELDLPGRVHAVREAGIVRLSVRAGGVLSAEGETPAWAELQTPLYPAASGEKTEVYVPPAPEASAGENGRPGTGGWRIEMELLGNSAEVMCQIVEKKYTKWLSYDTIGSDTLMFRTRQPGDYLVINREGGRKKLKDYLIDLKVPRERRDDLPLLAVGSHVLWAVGCRISEAAKVTEDTERILKIKVEEETNEGEDTDLTDRAGGQREDRPDGCSDQQGL